ncbi:hypothetical protein D3C73_831290 [compost metagenome]
MLATGFGDFYSAKFSFVSQYTYVLETLRADQLCISLMLCKQRNVFWQCFLCGIVPVVKVGMSNDDRINTGNDVLYRSG